MEDVVPFLEQLTGDGEGRIIELVGTRVSFGRGPDNDIVILSESVSRNHAAIFQRAKQWFVEDIGSKNGVLVNGSFHKKTPLAPGDVLQIGEVAFRFNRPQLTGMELEPTAIKRRPYEAHAYQVPQPADLNAFIDSVENKLVQMNHGSNRLSFYLLSVLGLVGLIFLSFPMGKKVAPATVTGANLSTEDIGVTTVRGLADKPESEVAPLPPLKLSSGPDAFLGPKRDPIEDHEEIATYLEEGRKFLRHRDFESAAKAFQFALIIDTENQTAMRGIYAAEHRMSDLEEVPLKELPEIRKSRSKRTAKRGAQDRENEKANVLIEKARRELAARSYTAAINAATAVQKLRLAKESALGEEALGIAAKARQARREEFEPFLLQAKDKLEAKEYRAARNLCDEILRRDPAYEEAKDCLRRAVRGQ